MPSERESVSSPPLESRKNTKPVMEKRRRARINASLCELKSLLLEVMKKEGARHNKMEKADILEMTVKHLRQIQRHQFTAAATADPSVVTKYQSGFAECAHEVTRYLSTVEGVDVDLKSRMLNHLAGSIQGVMGRNVTSQTAPPHNGHSVVNIAPKLNTNPTVVLTTGLDVNNNMNNVILGNFNTGSSPTPHTTPIPTMHVSGNSSGSPQKIIGGVQLIPTRLPGGEVAFMLPNNMLSAGGQVPGYVIPLYTGATPPTMVTTNTATASCTGTSSPSQGESPPRHGDPAYTSGLALSPTGSGSGQSTVLPAQATTDTTVQPCSSPEPSQPINLTSANTTSPSNSHVTLRPNLTLKVEEGLAMAPGEEVDMEGVEDVVRDKSMAPAGDENVWRPW